MLSLALRACTPTSRLEVLYLPSCEWDHPTLNHETVDGLTAALGPRGGRIQWLDLGSCEFLMSKSDNREGDERCDFSAASMAPLSCLIVAPACSRTCPLTVWAFLPFFP